MTFRIAAGLTSVLQPLGAFYPHDSMLFSSSWTLTPMELSKFWAIRLRLDSHLS